MDRKWQVFTISLGAFFLYALTTSEVLSAAHDSAGYMAGIMAGKSSWFHPFHLIFNGLAWLWVQLLSALGYSGQPHQSVGLLNALLGAVSVGTCYWILSRRLRLKTAAAFWGTVLVGSSYSMWYYNGAVEVFALATASSLLLLNKLLKTYRDDRDHWWVSGLFAVAILAHVTTVFWVFSIAWSYLRRSDKKALFNVMLRTGLIVSGTYLLVMIFGVGVRSVDEAIFWLRGISGQGQYWHVPWALSTWVKASIGAGRAIIGGHFMMALESVYGLVQAMFPTKWIMDERFLVRGLRLEIVVILILFSIGIVSTTVATALRFRYLWSNVLNRHYPFWVVMALWVGPLSLLFLVWEPQNHEYWIPFSIFLWMGLTVLVSRAQRHQILIPIAVLLFLTNFIGSIALTQNRENDYYYYHLSPVVEKSGAFGVVSGRSWQYKEYLNYYCPEVTVLSWDTAPFTDVAEQVSDWSALPGPMYVLQNAIQLEPVVQSRFPTLQYKVADFWAAFPDHLEVLAWCPIVFIVQDQNESIQTHP